MSTKIMNQTKQGLRKMLFSGDGRTGVSLPGMQPRGFQATKLLVGPTAAALSSKTSSGQ